MAQRRGRVCCAGGQFFNLFNLGKTDAEMKELKTKELTMLAVFGYGAQAVLTGVGPFQVKPGPRHSRFTSAEQAFRICMIYHHKLPLIRLLCAICRT